MRLKLTKEQLRHIEDLISQMTVDEKIGQLNQLAPSPVGGFEISIDEQKKLFEDGRITKEEYDDAVAGVLFDNHEDDIRAGKIGSVLGLLGSEKCDRIQRIAVEESRMHIPLLFGYDVIHGHRTVFPIPLAESCSWNEKIWEESAAISAKEASADGINWVFAPMVDIARDARWGRIAEGAGEDTFLGSKCAAARVRGFQGSNPADPGRVIACAKHFAAYGAAIGGRDYNAVDMSDRELREVYLPPFKAALEAGAATIMAGFNSLNGVPCTSNKYLLKDILRKEWEFDGMVVSDAHAILELINHGAASDHRHASNISLNAGIDMDMNSRCYISFLKELIESGRVSENTLDNAVRNVLKVKMLKGLFDQPYTKIHFKDIDLSEHRRAARKVACESAVLLKNNGALPLKGVQNLLLVGSLASNASEMYGTWSFAASPEGGVSLKDGLEKRKIGVKYIPCCGPDKIIDEPELNCAIESPESLVIAVVGELSSQSGEGGSRSDISLPGEQNEMLRRLKESGKTVITVLCNGRPLALGKTVEYSDAVLELWNAGSEAGNAAADILFGDVDPSGRLTVSFPHKSGECPIYYNHTSTGRPGGDSFYTSRYIDTPPSALFEFGHGLSFNKYEYSDLSVNVGNTVEAEVTVKNTGKRPGKETVQLYITDPVASIVRPVLELKGFLKVSLNPGESKRIGFSIPFDQLKFFDSNSKPVFEFGEFRLHIGHDSQTGLEKNFIVCEDKTTLSATK